MGTTTNIKEAVQDQVIPNWRSVLKRAWSVRLMLLAGLLSGVEAILPAVNYLFNLDVEFGWVFALVTFLVVAGAFVMRFVVQNNLGGSQS